MDNKAKLSVEAEREQDGRWLADIPGLPGVMAYGLTRDEAISRTMALALHVMADEIEHGERRPDSLRAIFDVAA